MIQKSCEQNRFEQLPIVVGVMFSTDREKVEILLDTYADAEIPS
ncbi:MAG: hypothetical protein WC136_05215 [Sphaerochaeta sp.]|nr:hypothetical protein [Sphaerochaeta sp.]